MSIYNAIDSLNKKCPLLKKMNYMNSLKIIRQKINKDEVSDEEFNEISPEMQ